MLSNGMDAVRLMREQFDDEEGLPFRPLLQGELIEEVFSEVGIDFRDRVFSPDVTVMAMCSQVLNIHNSCRSAVARVNTDRVAQNLPEISLSSSGYCQARARLPGNVVSELARRIGLQTQETAGGRWYWKNRNINIIDGTTFSAPDTQQNQKLWPQNKEQKAGLGFPIIRGVALISLGTASVINMALGACEGVGMGEPSLARQLFDDMKPRDILLADSCYSGYFLMAELLDRRIDIVTRCSGTRKIDLESSISLGDGDYSMELIKPPKPKWMSKEEYEAFPKALKVRLLTDTKIKDSEGKEVEILTTLVEPENYERSELLALAKRRWNIEIDFNSIKSVMGLGVLTCKTPDLVKKEIWTYILAYNLIRQLICKAAQVHDVEPRRISFTDATNIFLSFAPFISNGTPSESQRMYQAMLRSISKSLIPHRPNRSEPRVLKRRKHKYPLMKEPRKSGASKNTIS